MTTAQQPEALPDALRLADEITWYGRYGAETEDQAKRRRMKSNADAAAELRRLHALTAQDGWQPIESAPEGEPVLVGWVDAEDSLDRQDFDMLEEGVWQAHEESREHFLMVAPPGSRGPKEKAPYTHWQRIRPLPAPPAPEALEVP